MSDGTRNRRRSSGPSSVSATALRCRSSPRAWKPRSSSASSRTKAATRCRAISSANLCRSATMPGWLAASTATPWSPRARPARRWRMADFDLAIIGGGLNGVSVARDAAGRGLRVILLEQGDLGSAASSASPRLIHGDLAMLERWAFLRVRAALAERDIWLRIAPHLVRPMRFGLPAHSEERPPWLLRSGLWLYDRLGSARNLPGSATVDVTHHPIGNALKRPFGTAFEYSDCVVDDSRLVIANALDAAERGAVIRTGARCTRAERGATWRLVTIDRGHRQVVTARALVNATGAWTASVAETVLRQPPPDAALVQVSQIVVRRLFDCDNVYVFQNSDGR